MGKKLVPPVKCSALAKTKYIIIEEDDSIKFVIKDRIKTTRRILRPKIINCCNSELEEFNVANYVRFYLDATKEFRISNLNNGENLLYLARKEQCLALGTQLRTFKINDYKIYRIFPSGEVQYLHPKDGVFPEKVNPGRTAINSRNFSIGKNPNPASIKFSGNTTYEI